MDFGELEEFKKDRKRLGKKYKTLEEDLAVVRQVLAIRPKERPPFSFRIKGLSIEACVVKAKKIACKSLKGKGVNSGLRLVYAYFGSSDKIVFIELYHKNEKESEDQKRILSWAKKTHQNI